MLSVDAGPTSAVCAHAAEQRAHTPPVLMPHTGISGALVEQRAPRVLRPPTLPLVCPGAVRRSTARLPGLGCLVSRWCIEADGTNRTYKLFNIYVGPQQSRALLFCVTAKSSGQHFVFVPPLASRVPWCFPEGAVRYVLMPPLASCVPWFCLEESSALTQHLCWCHPLASRGHSCALVLSGGEQRAHPALVLVPTLATRVPWFCLEESSALTQHLCWCHPLASRGHSCALVLSGGEQRAHPALVLVPTLATRVPWFCLEESSALTQHLCWCLPLASPGHSCALVLSCGEQRAHTPPVLMPPPGISCARAKEQRAHTPPVLMPAPAVGCASAS